MSEYNKDIVLEKLIAEIRQMFPEVSGIFDEWIENNWADPDDTPYSLLLERFSQATTDAIKIGNNERAEEYLKFISAKLSSSEQENEKSLIDSCYVEHLIWDDFSGDRKRKCWELMPKNLQKLYFNFWGRKTYYKEE